MLADVNDCQPHKSNTPRFDILQEGQEKRMPV